MKDTSFRSRFSLLLRMVWSQVTSSEGAVEAIRSANKMDQSLIESEEGKLELDDIIVKNVDEEEAKQQRPPKLNLKMIQVNETES